MSCVADLSTDGDGRSSVIKTCRSTVSACRIVTGVAASCSGSNLQTAFTSDLFLACGAAVRQRRSASTAVAPASGKTSEYVRYTEYAAARDMVGRMACFVPASGWAIASATWLDLELNHRGHLYYTTHAVFHACNLYGKKNFISSSKRRLEQYEKTHRNFREEKLPGTVTQ